MTCIRLLASKRRSLLKEILYTKEVVPGMRSWPKQFASFSINTRGQSSFWQGILRTAEAALVRTAVGQFVRKSGGELLLQLLQLADFGFGLDYLLVMVWTL
jgi:hypothetical protein